LKQKDDCTLTKEQYEIIRREAKRALEDAGAMGVFPTPVSDIMSAANVHEVHEDVLSDSFVDKLRKEVGKVGSVLRKALSKVIGLFDARSRLVFIDRALHAVKQTFIRLHETAHGFLSWQKDMYAVVEDSKQNLDPDVADLFDKEANVFASEVLFQIDTFAEEANDHEFSIFTPVRISKKYGASIYSAVRQYVSKNPKACTVIVLDPPVLQEGNGFRANLRRAISSHSFQEQYGDLQLPEFFTPNDKIGAMVPIGKRRASGKREIVLEDRNGVAHECIAEAFTQGYQVFVLIVSVKALTSTTILLTSATTSS
jgi:Zn-dependent peptidase ImmA (M78 family)